MEDCNTKHASPVSYSMGYDLSKAMYDNTRRRYKVEELIKQRIRSINDYNPTRQSHSINQLKKARQSLLGLNEKIIHIIFSDNSSRKR
jgi:hypothetical protein